MALDELLEKLKSWFRKKEIPETNNRKNIKKPFRGLSPSELEDLSYALEQPDYGETHIKNIEELEVGGIYEYIKEQVNNKGKIEKHPRSVRILGINKQTGRIKIQYTKTSYESEHDAFYFGLAPSNEGRHKNQWKKDSYLIKRSNK